MPSLSFEVDEDTHILYELNRIFPLKHSQAIRDKIQEQFTFEKGDKVQVSWDNATDNFIHGLKIRQWKLYQLGSIKKLPLQSNVPETTQGEKK